ncbi:hypothetical protein AB0I22_39255 [Streptomyces sp. NPDC050610]|uniref:hypothetical protein n=1 Tax=Streptomyces sp. NPDC050610 TaxID=3157097 RepID=UPI0034278DA1
MIELALPDISEAGRWIAFLTGAGWLALGVALGVSNTLSYRRQVTVSARCKSVEKLSKQEYSHLLRRKPVAGEDGYVLLSAKQTKRLRVGEEVRITYDPRSAHLVFVGDEYPRFTHGKAIIFCTALGMIPIMFAVLA